MRKIILSIIFIILSFGINQTFAGISLSPLKYEFNIDAGTITRERIKITNTGDETITVYSSKQDFISGDDNGTPKFVDESDKVSNNLVLSDWISIEDNNITLAPKETKEVLFSIKAPSDAEPGGHYAAIFFSPGASQGGQIAVLQRIGVLILVDVSGDVKIDGNLSNFEIGNDNNGIFTQNDKFNDFPITFKTTFENGGNVHFKPTGKIELLDENGEILKNVGSEVLATENGTYLGEKLVDYIPVNDQEGNVLPNSERIFTNVWQGFGYNILNEDGTKGVNFKSFNEYYKDNSNINSKYLMFWQKINTRNTTKTITARYDLSYEGKDKVLKSFSGEKKFKVTYQEEYVGINYLIIVFLIILIGIIGYYIKFILPKQKEEKEKKLREKILEELKNNDNN